MDESFPRMWDQQCASAKTVCGHRIIPTYVGSTFRNVLNNVVHVESFPRMWDQRERPF